MKPIKNFEDRYSVRPDGAVVSHKTGLPMKASLSNSGYEFVHLSAAGRRYHGYVHRLVAEAYHPQVEGMTDVNHIDGDKRNNAAENLEWISRSGNLKHAYRLGLRKPTPQLGSRHGESKLTEGQVVDIKKLLKKGLSLDKTASRFGVSKPTIWKISKGLSWRHV